MTLETRVETHGFWIQSNVSHPIFGNCWEKNMSKRRYIIGGKNGNTKCTVCITWLSTKTLIKGTGKHFLQLSTHHVVLNRQSICWSTHMSNFVSNIETWQTPSVWKQFCQIYNLCVFFDLFVYPWIYNKSTNQILSSVPQKMPNLSLFVVLIWQQFRHRPSLSWDPNSPPWSE